MLRSNRHSYSLMNMLLASHSNAVNDELSCTNRTMIGMARSHGHRIVMLSDIPGFGAW